MRGINFLILTDENVFTSYSINYTQYVLSITSGKCPWIYNWQNSNATYKFPTSATDLDSPNGSESKKVASDMVNIFKQMSYYYGVNMTFGLSEIVSLGQE